MHSVTHLLVGWTVANTADLSRRDRAIVTVAGVIPDVDGLGFLIEQVTRNSDNPVYWYSTYHHTLAHNLGFALVAMMIAFALADRRIVVPLLAFLTFHLHLLGDLVGSRGPDGYPWPIPYLLPFSRSMELTWSGQWELNAWPNIAVTIVMMVLAIYWAWRNGFSPLELISSRLDAGFVSALRRRFGVPAQDLHAAGRE